MLTRAALRRPVTTLMLFLSLMVVGGISSRMLPLEFFPQVNFPGMFVQLPYPGSTPSEVEEQILRPAEEALATISGVKGMNANADENGGGIFLQFDWGTDTQIAALEAREKLDGVRHLFPSDFERFFVFKFTSGDQPILILRVSSERDLSNAYELLDRTVRSRLERVEGVAQVDLYGVQPRSIRIEIDADRVEAYGVDLRQLTGTLQQANFSLTAGTLSDGGRRFLVRPLGELSTPEAVAALPIGVPGVRLRDIADVRYEQPEQTEGRHLDRTYAVGMNVQKEADANTVAVSDAVLAELELLRTDPNLKGVSIYPMENVAEGIRSSLNELLTSGMYGAVFAVLILFVFLRRVSTTLIVALAVPVSILITLGALQALGLTLNIFSMMGLMLAIGMLVDNAVVVVENIHQRQLETPLDPHGAAQRGTKEVGMVIVAGTLTNAIVFLPFIVSPADDVTTFLKHVSIPICIAIGVSLVLSLTVVPMLTARMKPPKAHGKTWIDGLSERYERFLGWTLRHRSWSALGVVLLLFSVALPFALVDKEFFPDNDENGRQLRLLYNINDSYTLERVEATVDLVEEYLYAKKDSFEIASVYSYYTPGSAQSTLILTDEEDAQLSLETIRERIREDLPQIAIGTISFDWQGGSGSSFQVSLAGESSERLEDLAEDLATMLGRVDGLEDIRTEAQAGSREVHVVVDRERARRYGFTAQDVAQTVSAAMRGQNLRRFRTPEGEVDVRLAFREEDQSSLDDLRRLTLRTPEGQTVQLDALASFEVSRAAQRINRQDRITTTTLRANLDGITSEEARERAQPVLDRYRLPTGYSWSYGRQFRNEQDSQNLLGVNLLIALALIYLVMAGLFESLIYPAAIWSSILFALVGVMWFLFLTGTSFGIMAIIGIFVLIGVVVNNGIVLLDHVGQLRAQGLAREDALLRAGRERLRPILMTALTTVLSLIPLCVGDTQVGGEGGPPYYPMARAIVGGLVFSTVVTLVVLPTIYLWLDNLSLWGKRMKRIGSGDEPVRSWRHSGDGAAVGTTPVATEWETAE